MSKSPEEIQRAMRKAIAAGDKGAVDFFRGELAKAYKSEVPSAAEDMTGGQKFLAGVGSGMTDIARKAVNLVTPGEAQGFGSKAAIEEQGKTDRDLLSTGAGMAGNIVGQVAATAPVGMGAGGLIRGAGLGARAGQAALQGASEGVLAASPDDRLAGAAMGAGLGGGLSGAAGLGGKLLRRAGRGVVDVTDEAAELQKILREIDPEAIIPLSQAAKPGLAKQVYEGFVANIPGGKVRQQLGKAQEVAREAAIAKVLPEGIHPATVFEAASEDTAQEGLSRLMSVWDDAWTPVNTTRVTIPEDFFSPGFEKLAWKQFRYRLPKAGEAVGEDLTKASQAIQEMINELPGGQLGAARRKYLIGWREKVDNLLKSQLDGDALETYTKNKDKYGAYQALLKAASSAPGTGEFTSKALSRAASKKAGAAGLGGGVEGTPLAGLQRLGVLGEKSLQNFPSRQGVFQTLAATGAAGAGAGYLAGENPTVAGIAGILAPVAGARLLSSPAVQRRLVEGLSTARKAGMGMDEYKKLLEGLGFTARQIAVATSVKE